MQNLFRRGFNLGLAPTAQAKAGDPLSHWFSGSACKLDAACLSQLAEHHENMRQTEQLVLTILNDESAEEALEQTPYKQRLSGYFESLGAAYNEGDEQEIEMVMFDAVVGDKTTAEDLWMKVSWLSFHDEDASLRFRFSFGVDLEEDVAADAVRHDLERGHAGVVYAQLSGATLWLCLPQQTLVEEIRDFITHNELPKSLNQAQQQELLALAKDADDLSQALNSFAHDALIHLINETEAFVQFLIGRQHYRILEAGDAILLPQKNPQMCCWHSVFCLGDEMGQALSFAIR